MAKKLVLKLIVVAMGAASFAHAQDLVPPPPQLSGIEFFVPTPRKHTISATCQRTGSSISWSFDGERARISSFKFSNTSARRDQIAQMNGWIANFKGDIVVYLECNRDAAGITMTEIAPWRQQSIKQVRFDWLEGRAKLISSTG
jgi:hypothetical protein